MNNSDRLTEMERVLSNFRIDVHSQPNIPSDNCGVRGSMRTGYAIHIPPSPTASSIGFPDASPPPTPPPPLECPDPDTPSLQVVLSGISCPSLSGTVNGTWTAYNFGPSTWSVLVGPVYNTGPPECTSSDDCGGAPCDGGYCQQFFEMDVFCSPGTHLVINVSSFELGGCFSFVGPITLDPVDNQTSDVCFGGTARLII